MPFIPFADTVRAAIRYRVSTHEWVNTMWFRNLGGFSEVTAETLAEDLATWVVGVLGPSYQVLVQFVDVTVYDMTSDSGFVIVNDDGAGVIGEGAGNILPLNTALTVTFQTNKRGRSYRGRNYLTGFEENVANEAVWTSLHLDNIEAAYAALEPLIDDAGWQHVVASQYQDGAPLLVGVTTPVTNYRANARVYRQGDRTK